MLRKKITSQNRKYIMISSWVCYLGIEESQELNVKQYNSPYVWVLQEYTQEIPSTGVQETLVFFL